VDAHSELSVRVLLERGRILNSRGAASGARPLFEQAYELATAAGLEHLAVDALHMIAIVALPAEQLALSEKSLAVATAASDPRAREWRASLLNNLGWTYFEAGNLELALGAFSDAVDERVQQGKAREIGLAKWSVARTLREMGRVHEAIELQQDLVRSLAASGITDSYVEEEIGECLLALDRSEEAAPHFDAAANLLENGGPGETPDAVRLARLRERARLAAQSSTTPEPGTG
jgi:tetratricopeptide (TPR) repeat protein